MPVLNTYTVVGVHPDTAQRFVDFIEAANPDAAEKMIRQQHPALWIASVFEGDLTPVDTKSFADE